MKKRKSFFEAIAILVGTIMGAGVLGIPYAVAKAGFVTGLVLMILLGLGVLIINLAVGEFVLRTKGNHQLTGYAEKYLGKKGKLVMTLTMIVGLYGALVAYLIGSGEALSAIFNGNPFFHSLVFFAAVSLIIYFGVRAVGHSELFFVFIFLTILLLISIFSFSSIDMSNLKGFNFYNSGLIYGVVLFALGGAISIPEMKEELVKNKKSLKKAIIIGTLIPIVFYPLFAFVVVGVTGGNTTEISTVGLGNVVGQYVVMFGNLFAVFVMATSFLTLGLGLKEMYNYDYKINKKLAWLLTIIVPLGLFLLGIRSFINTLGFTGAIAGGIEGILFILIFWKARKYGDRKPEYSVPLNKVISGLLIMVFSLGIIYALSSLF